MIDIHDLHLNNKQVEVKDSLNQPVGQYVYDGDGKRVKKYIPATGEITIFVYDSAGKLIGEYSTIVQPSQDTKTQYLTNDHLGTPRINTDSTGQIVSRSDYMPYGEEIVGLGGRSSGQGYVADDVRQGFTGYENDDETGLDYAQARMYSSDVGRFSASDPLLSNGRPRSPESWNRYSYTLNNPLKLTDPSGMYECLGSKSECKQFESGRKLAESTLGKIRDKYGEGSDEYVKASNAIAAYGKAGVANGVFVSFGATKTGAPGEASGILGPNNQKAISVVFDLKNSRNNDAGAFAASIAHEGSHVYDRGKLADAAITALKADPTYEKGLFQGVFDNTSLNITSNQTETTAYVVNSVVAQFLLKNEVAPESSGGQTVLSNRTYISKIFPLALLELSSGIPHGLA